MISLKHALQHVLRGLLPLAILATASGGFLALQATRSQTPRASAPERIWPVSTTIITPQFHSPELLLYGTVEAPRQADLSAAINADVAEVTIAEGQLVQQNQVLVRLERRDSALLLRQREADVADIKASIESEKSRHQSQLAALQYEQTMLTLAEREVARAEDLLRRKVGSDAQVDQARLARERQALAVSERQWSADDHTARLAQLQARLARAESLRDQAQLDLSRTEIKSPFAGRIAKVLVARGDRVRVGDLLVQLYAQSELEIRAQIPFRNLATVQHAWQTGQRLTAQVRADDQTVTATLQRLSGQAQTASGGVDALFQLPETAEARFSLVPGRLLPVLLALPAQPDTVALPISALYGLNRIYRLEEGRMQAIDVERVGERREADGQVRILVRSPLLKQGDQIVTTQLPNAVTGLRADVVSR